jgi:hypothetical protein
MKWKYGLVISLLISSPALANQIDFGHVLLDENGKPAKDPAGQTADDPQCVKCPDFTLGIAAAHALVAQLPDERDLDPLQKWARGDMAMRLKQGKVHELSAEEVAVIKRLIGKIYGPWVVMQTYPLLDPGSKPPEVK